jgi:hypothetical protein
MARVRTSTTLPQELIDMVKEESKKLEKEHNIEFSVSRTFEVLLKKGLTASSQEEEEDKKSKK